VIAAPAAQTVIQFVNAAGLHTSRETMETSSKPNTEEHVLAAVVHASALFSFFGPIVPGIIWFTSRGKSAYLAFHAMQAMGYQMMSYWLWATIGPIFAFGLPFLMVPFGSKLRELPDPETIMPVMILFVWGSFLAVFGVYFVIAMAGAILCLAGHNFNYPLLGNWLARRTGYLPGGETPLSEAGEDRYLAAIAHSTAIVAPCGAIFPLLIWATQKDRSPFLRFQSVQAALFQVIGAAAYLVGLLFYVIFVFGIMGLAGIAASFSRSQIIPPALVLLLIPILCLIFLFFGLGPLYLCLASWASYCILRGQDYRYPLLGRILARRMESGKPGGVFTPPVAHKN